MTHELCVGECPEVFEIGRDAEFPVARLTERAREFFVSHEHDIRSAARLCPVDAIRIEEA